MLILNTTQEFYALGKERTARFARVFLDHFLPNRKSLQDEYLLPSFSANPTVILTAEDEVLDYLEHHPNESYSLYWSDVDRSSDKQVMLFYTEDGRLIYGLAGYTPLPAHLLRKLAEFVGADYSMFSWEAPPPLTAEEFIELCRSKPAHSRGEPSFKVISIVNSIAGKLSRMSGIELTEFLCGPPVSPGALQNLEDALAIRLPEPYREMLLHDASEVTLKWRADEGVFGPLCSSGHLELMSPEKVLSTIQDMRATMLQALAEGRKGPGYDKVILSWPFWIPFCQLSNGDAFCFDIRFYPEYAVVLLPHDVIHDDVMHVRSGDHGRWIAPTFQELIRGWSTIGFVELGDWSQGGEMGIDPGVDVFRDLVKRLSM